MGRSQVLRNRTRGRPGQGRGGRGGRGRGGNGGGRSTSCQKGSGASDPRKLGDNAFRFQRGSSTSDAGGGGDDYDGLLDDVNFISSGVGLGEYYGDSHYDANREEDDLADATLSAATAAISLSERDKKNNDNQQQQNGEVEDWMTIDVKALDKYLRQIPIHERLKLPHHIGKHLEEMYGVDGRGGGGSGGRRKKSLAELREESKCITNAEEEGEAERQEVASSDSKLEKKGDDNAKRRTDSEQSETQQTHQPDSNATRSDNVSGDDAAEDEEEDLEAWLDDMIA